MALSHAPYLEGDLQEYIYDKYPYEFGRKDWTTGQTIKGEWRVNDPFTAVMTFDGTGRGRSAVRIYWKDEHGHRYPMFLTDFEAILENGHVMGSKAGNPVTVPGEWRAVKRGSNFGIQRIGDI